jgi:hypothetical protein
MSGRQFTAVLPSTDTDRFSPDFSLETDLTVADDNTDLAARLSEITLRWKTQFLESDRISFLVADVIVGHHGGSSYNAFKESKSPYSYDACGQATPRTSSPFAVRLFQLCCRTPFYRWRRRRVSPGFAPCSPAQNAISRLFLQSNPFVALRVWILDEDSRDIVECGTYALRLADYLAWCSLV